ncbi:MAG: hypothetical protein ACM3UV_04955 [Nocardioidaceae bacterium]
MTALIRIDRLASPDANGPGPVRFCARCAHVEDAPVGLAPERRVCPGCQMGLMLACGPHALPDAGAAFLVATAELRVSAVSAAGEAVLGPERSLVGTKLLELLTSPIGNDALAAAVARAAEGSGEPALLPVRLAYDGAPPHGTMAARIAPCWPPRAALVTVEPTAFGWR